MEVLSDLLLRGFIFFVRILPASWVQPLGRCIAAFVALVARRDNRILKENIARIYQLPADSHFSEMFRKQVFRHQVICTLETIKCTYDWSLVKVEGYEEFERLVADAADSHTGVLMVTAHIGSWELCARYCSNALPRMFNVLAKPSKNQAFNRFLENLRGRAGATVFWTDRRSLLKDMLGALKKREGLGFVMDQKPDSRKGPIVDFFGLPTAFVSGPATMAIRSGAAVISVFCLRTGPYSYRVVSGLIAPKDHGITDEIELTGSMARAIESVIRDYPEQWTWNYKRWRFDNQFSH